MKNYKGIIILVCALVLVFVLASLLNTTNATLVDYSTFEQNLEAGNIKAVYVTGNYEIKILYSDSVITEKQFPSRYDSYCYIDARDNIASIINEKVASYNEGKPEQDQINVKLIFDNPSSGNFWVTAVSIGGMLLLIILLVVLFFRNSGANNKAFNFGKTNARANQPSKVRFNDVAGAEEEKQELAEIVEFLKNPRKFTELGARIPKGVLLVGPPGTGKTLFAKAVSGEAGVPFFSISGSDFVEMFVGVGASRVRDIFDQAKKNMPCIIFIDEIDAVGRQRGTGLGGGHDEREQTLNQLLVQMDGFDTNEGIIVMAATNRADILDPALLRPGRFDRQVYVNLPDVRGREAILKVHARNKPLDKDVNFKILARMTSGFTGADIENLLNESAILAARANKNTISMKDILEGIDKVIAGPRKSSRLVTESDKRITAYHESGHAILSKCLKHCDEVQEVSIIPRGMAAGYTLSRPDNDDNHVTKNKLLDMITMMLGGRAAEQIIIKDISTGASNDIQRASSIARSMVTEWGMSSEIGNFFLGGSHEVFIGRDYQAQHTYSEELAGKIDDEIKKILDTCYANALKILEEKRSVMENMVKVLFEKETIYTNEVNALMDGASAETVIAMDSERNIPSSPTAHIIIEEKVDEPQTSDNESAETEDNKPASADDKSGQQTDNDGQDKA
ncbi:MAG: ATP-dependent zinc metalloprotease FtsH [Christensenellales bacterium]